MVIPCMSAKIDNPDNGTVAKQRVGDHVTEQELLADWR